MSKITKAPVKHWKDGQKGKICISWSDTDLSFDFACGCGASLCGGGTYCTYIKCPKCLLVYGLPLVIELDAITGDPPHRIEPKMMEE